MIVNLGEDELTLIRSIYLSPEEIFRTGLDVSEFAELIKDPDGLLWVDFEASPPETDEKILQEAFQLSSTCH